MNNWLKQPTMIARALTLLICILSIPARSDQTLYLAYHNCSPVTLGQAGSQLDAAWENAPQSICRYPLTGTASNWQPAFQCLNYQCMNNCDVTGCQYCDRKICAAANITVDGSCSSPTSLLWITTQYTGGGGSGGGGHCGSHPC